MVEVSIGMKNLFSGGERHGRENQERNFIFPVERGFSVPTPLTRNQNRMKAEGRPNNHVESGVFSTLTNYYYYYYCYHSDIIPCSEYMERSSMISPRYQRSSVEVVA